MATQKTLRQKHEEAMRKALTLPTPHVHLRTQDRPDLDQPGGHHTIARNMPDNPAATRYLHAATLICSGEFREATPEEIAEYEASEKATKEALRRTSLDERAQKLKLLHQELSS